MHLTRNSPSGNKTGHELMPPLFLFHKIHRQEGTHGHEAGEFLEGKTIILITSESLSQAQEQKLNKHSIKILYLCSSIKLWETVNAKSNHLEINFKVHTYIQILSTDVLNLTSQGNICPEKWERIYFTFYPISAQWGYVKFKYPTELQFPILRWMKQLLMTYYKTIPVPSELSYISHQSMKVPTPKRSEAHPRHCRPLQIRFHSCHMQHGTFPE